MSDTVRVERLWRYPVKSMLGQCAETVAIGHGGVVGDRRYAIREASGRLGSGKNTSRFRKIDGLFRFRACYDGNRALLTFPDGTEMDAEDPAIDVALSRTLGQPVTLVREDTGAHFDDRPLHLMTTTSLDWLKRTLPDAQVDERRFRPNLVLDIAGDECIEQDWIGRALRIGDDTVLFITGATERCGMVAFEQDELPHDPRVLRHITKNAGLMFGVYAEVIRAGSVCVGDAVTVASAADA